MAARNRRPGPKSPGRHIFWIALCTATFGGLGAGALAGELLPPGVWGTATPAPDGKPRMTGPTSLMPRLDRPLTVLLMATDVDYTYKDGKRVMGLRGRTDTMMLARLDPGSDQIRMLSIPRDTRVEIAGHGGNKINAANPFGGPELAVSTVSEFLQVPVDRYLLINTVAVQQIVDALGGVDMYVPKRMKYDDWSGGLHIDLQPGWNHLDGKKAHDFLRFRHDNQGDIGRVQRQQMFLEALMKQYMTPVNLLKTPQLLALARENSATNLTNDELVRIVAWGKDLDRDKVQMGMVPGTDAMIHGGWYWVADPEGTKKAVGHFLEGEVAAELQPPSAYRVTIQDGVGDREAVRALRKALTDAGYSVELGERTPDMAQAETEIQADGADAAGARALQATLGTGKVVVAAIGNRSTDITIVMGRDWVEKSSQTP